MTITSTDTSVTANGNGTTTDFPWSFLIPTQADLEVVQTSASGVETVKTVTTDYTVTGLGDDNGGTVTMLSPPADGELLTIRRVTATTQQTDLTTGSSFYAEVFESALDKLTMIAQELDEKIGRCLKVSVSDSGADVYLPSAPVRAGFLLGFDEDGNLTVTTYQTLPGSGNTATGPQAFAVGGASNAASGTNSAAISGQGNTASGTDSVTIGGYDNTATAAESVVIGGFGNDATGSESAIVGGAGNTASGTQAAIVGGQNNTASGAYSSASGRYGNALWDASHSHGFGSKTVEVSAGVIATTTDDTPTECKTTVNTRLSLPNNSQFVFEALVNAHRTDVVGERASYHLRGAIARNGTAVTTALQGSASKTVINESDSTWDVSAAADTTNGALQFTVTGAVGKTIKWFVAVRGALVTS